MGFLSHECSFQKWILTPQEIGQGSILTLTQKQIIQNQIADLAEEQINLPFSQENIQRNAELIGAINALRHLFTISDYYENQLHQAATHTASDDYSLPREHSPEN